MGRHTITHIRRKRQRDKETKRKRKKPADEERNLDYMARMRFLVNQQFLFYGLGRVLEEEASHSMDEFMGFSG